METKRENVEEEVKFYWGGIRSEAMLSQKKKLERIMERVTALKGDSLRIIIYGEPGVGKTGMAQTIFCLLKKASTFHYLDIGQINDVAANGELQGVEKKSHSGVDKRIGKFEEANGGLLFLDEIHNASWKVQGILLNVIANEMVRRAGSTVDIPAKFHLVVGTNEDLIEAIDEKKFRRDLYRRIKMLPLTIPPLRDRPEDIIPIAKNLFAKHLRNLPYSVAQETYDVLQTQPYRYGNVGELSDLIYISCMAAEELNPFTPSSLLFDEDAHDFNVDLGEDLIKRDLIGFYNGIRFLGPPKNQCKSLLDNWRDYHLENETGKALDDIKSLKGGQNEEGVTFSQFKKVLRTGYDKIKSIENLLDLRLKWNVSGSEEEMMNKVRRGIQNDSCSQFLSLLPKTNLEHIIDKLSRDSSISKKDFDILEALSQSSFTFDYRLNARYWKFERLIRSLKNLVKNTGRINGSGTTFDSLGDNDDLIKQNVISILNKIKKIIDQLYNTFENLVRESSYAQKEIFDQRIQKWENGPLTEEYSIYLKELKNRLDVSYNVFGEMLEVISGTFLGNIIRYESNIRTDKAYQLKRVVELIALEIGFTF